MEKENKLFFKETNEKLKLKMQHERRVVILIFEII